MASNLYGVDLGTANIKMFSKMGNEAVSEKNTIAIRDKREIYAYGDDAYAMYEKVPQNITVSFPMVNGVIADYMGLGGANDDEKVANLIAYLRSMNDALNIPQCIKNYGLDSLPCEQGFVPEEIFLERLPEIAKNAVADACTGSNPRAISVEEMEKLLKCCYYDTEVDF